jgi:Na+-transporting methylmalonyl-CoA/oxaloacetate decarboxylase gamma subunit
MGDASRREPAGGAFVLSILTALSLALWAMGDAVAREHEARDSSYTARKAARAAAVQKPKAAARRAALDKAPGNKFAGFDPAGFPATANRSPAGSAAHHAILSHPAAMQAYERRRIEHRATLLAARSRLPQHPLPGERGFTGVPPVGEKRFVSSEMVFHVAPTVSRQAVDDAARKLGLSTLGSHSVALTGGTLFHFRVADGRSVADAVRALEAEKIGVAQPNYVFKLQQDAPLAARTQSGDSGQYVVNKLRLGEVHRVAVGSNVLVAVIDSEIDVAHPDLAGAFVERFDAVGRADKPHVHGTGMTGAIVAHRQLKGVAPAAKILAIHAFSPDAAEAPQATTQHILAGLEWAIKKGARVINMSFAGPYDPMLQLAMKKAHDKGIVLIAAAGNMGPKSPPLYPAADPNVIAVTAIDRNDRLFAGANQGPHIAVAAPGVEIIEPAPNASYQVTTGTSVAAAHVSGIAALLIERNPALDPDSVHEILTSSARTLGRNGRDDQFGWGLVDPARALLEVDAQAALDARRNGGKPATAKPGPMSSR